jgi:hypothetical protein
METNGKTNGTNGGVRVDFDSAPTAVLAKRIFKFDDVPDIMTMEIPPIEWIVPDIIARGTITLWAGSGGAAKSYLVESLCVAVATGGVFLGRRCRQSRVLVMDYENPGFMVKDRFTLMAGGPIDSLKVWGTWLEQPPPQIGNDLLLTIAKESMPLLVFDPFRFAHNAEENDSTQMMGVMQHLRFCAAAGATVLIVHHVGKADGSTSRGSTTIRDHCDVAFLQELSEENGLITLKSNKIRFNPPMIVKIKPDFEEGTFEVTDSPEFVRQNDDMLALRKIVENEPGLSQNAVYGKSGMKKTRVVAMLKSGRGTFWDEVKEGHSLRYFPVVPKTGNNLGNKGTGLVEAGCSPVPMVLYGNREQLPTPPPTCSPS